MTQTVFALELLTKLEMDKRSKNMDLLLLQQEDLVLITQKTLIYKNIDPTCFIYHQQVKYFNLIILIFHLIYYLYEKKLFSVGFITIVIKSRLLTIVLKQI